MMKMAEVAGSKLSPEAIKAVRMQMAAEKAGELAQRKATFTPEGTTVEDHLRMLEEGQ